MSGAAPRPAPYRPPPTAEQAEIARLRHELEVTRHAAAILLHSLAHGYSTPETMADRRRAQQVLREHGYREIPL